jgi:Ca2+-binding EF-hand superfamily protein
MTTSIFNVPVPQDEQLRPYFETVDTDQDGKISAEELQVALSSGGFVFALSVAQKLVKLFDKSNTGKLGLPEFVQGYQFIQRMTQSFRTRDVSKDGKLSGDEVRVALSSSGYVLSDPVFQLMMAKFDHDKKGYWSFDAYIDGSLFLSSVRSTFAYYDLNKTGQVTFNFDAFMGAALSINK